MTDSLEKSCLSLASLDEPLGISLMPKTTTLNFLSSTALLEAEIFLAELRLLVEGGTLEERIVGAPVLGEEETLETTWL